MNAEERVATLVARWQQGHERGELVALELLCQDCPELLEQARAAIEKLRHDIRDLIGATLPPKSPLPSGFGAATATVPPTSQSVGGPGNNTDAIPGYTIINVLGHGGMGVVYKARQDLLNRTVALKMILAGAHAAPEQLKRFMTEAEAVAALSHANIVQIYEIGTHAGLPYFSMEFVSDGSLADKVREQPLPAREAATLVEQIARGVQVAHERGIVHRDLKPENVLLTAEGTPKVTDFGLAKRIESDSGLTRTGAVMGTPSYMAPEQADGKKTVGLSADVWALGAILYRLLTGRPPFQAPTPLDTMLQVLTEEPVPPSQLLPKLPRDLETICMKCLQKEPAKRYANAVALADDLHRFLAGEPIMARPIGRVERGLKWVRRNPVIAGATAIVALTLLAGTTVSYLKYREAERARGEEANRVKERDDALVAESEARLREEKAHADAAANAEQARQLVARMDLANGERQIEQGDSMLALPWSAEALKFDAADGHNQAGHALRLTTLWRSNAKLTQVLFLDNAAVYAELSKDGQRLVTASSRNSAKFGDEGAGEMRVWNATTGEAISPPVVFQGVLNRAVFSPDGKYVATAVGAEYMVSLPIGPNRQAQVWDAQTGKPIGPPLRHSNGVWQVEFSPDGQKVLTASYDGTIRVWEVATGTPITPPLRLGQKSSIARAGFSRDGRLVFAAERGGESSNAASSARVWDAATGKEASPLLRHASWIKDANLSPDGRRLVTVTWHNGAHLWDVVSGKEIPGPFQSEQGYWGQFAVFSPDGRYILIAAGNSVQLWDADTVKPATPPLSQPHDITHAEFDPDSRHFVITTSVVGGNKGEARIYDVATAKLLVSPLRHSRPVNHASFSANGRWLVTATGIPRSGESGEVRIWDLATLRPMEPMLKNCVPALSAMSYSPDGRFAYGLMNLDLTVWDAKTGAILPQFNIPESGVVEASFSADGTHFCAQSVDGNVRVWDMRTLGPAGPPINCERPVVSEKDLPKAGVMYSVVAPTPVPLSPRASNLLTKSDILATRAILSRNGQRLVTAIQPKSQSQRAPWSVQVWDVSTAKALGPTIHVLACGAIELSPDGSRVFIAADMAQFWDVATGKPTGVPISEPSYSIRFVAFAPDGRRLATASGDATARVWDTASGGLCLPSLEHGADVNHAVFSSTGRRLVTASNDLTARVWHAGAGDLMAPPLKHADNVRSAQFSPDDAWVVTVCEDKTVRVWDAETGQPLTPPLFTSSNVRRAWFSPDGKRILANKVGMVCSWKLQSESRPTEDWQLLSHILSGHRIDENTGLVSLAPQEFRREWEAFAKRWPLSERTAPPDDVQAWLRERDAGRKP